MLPAKQNSNGWRNRQRIVKPTRSYASEFAGVVMKSVLPRFILFTEVSPVSDVENGGQWKFTLQQVCGSERIEASDLESNATEERLQLFSVLRGLEALDQPSRVTLITASRYVDRGVRLGLEQWRDSAWQWERFGIMTPIKHADLWQRVDRALQFHRMDCRFWRVNTDESSLNPKRSRRAAPVLRLPNWLAWSPGQESLTSGLSLPSQIGFAN